MPSPIATAHAKRLSISTDSSRSKMEQCKMRQPISYCPLTSPVVTFTLGKLDAGMVSALTPITAHCSHCCRPSFLDQTLTCWNSRHCSYLLHHLALLHLVLDLFSPSQFLAILLLNMPLRRLLETCKIQS